MEFLIVWALLSFAVAVLASNRGRSAGGWFLLALITSPLIAGLFLLVSRNLSSSVSAAGQFGEAPTASTHLRCPDCRELVRIDARKCRHCNAALIPQTVDREPAPGEQAYKGASRLGKVLADEFSMHGLSKDRPDKDAETRR